MNIADLDLQPPIRIATAPDFPLHDLVTALADCNDSSIDLLIPETETRRIKQSFPLNTKLASFVEENRLTISQADIAPNQTVLLDRTTAYTSLEFGAVNEFVEIQAQATHSALDSEYSALREAANPVELDIVGWDTLLEQLEETVDTDTRDEFEHLIEAARLENLGALDEYAVAIIAAAQSGALQYDLSTWAEEVGLASKATFSRRKTSLEEQGIVYTENVPVDVGRPRHRLQLSPDIDSVTVQGDTLDYSRQTQSGSTDSTAPATEESSHSQPTDAPTRPEQQPDSDSPLAKIEAEVREAISDN
jgi:hypothetical protein